MDDSNEDDDLKLVKASAGLLSDLQDALPKLLWKPSEVDNKRGAVHTQVKQRDIEHVVNLVEPFQGEPQLLDTKLKYILPSISEAYTEYLRGLSQNQRFKHIDFQTATCKVLYTLCKVRGYKIVMGFLNNEPRYLEPVLQRIEETLSPEHESSTEWQIPYVLLLWLAHLTMTPFDLSSISSNWRNNDALAQTLTVRDRLPAIAERIVIVGFKYLTVSTKVQEAAAMLLVRLVSRPDMQKHNLAEALVSKVHELLQDKCTNGPGTIYEKLGALRFIAGVVDSFDLRHLIPDIYNTCVELSENEQSPTATNAVAKKLLVKIFRNTTTTALRSTSAQDPLIDFLENRGMLEEVIDYFLRSLGDRDTPVRYAGAKALSLIILQLEPSMAHDVIQAILNSFKEDLLRNGTSLDFRQVDALKWHGLTLALAHVLFKRSASPDQLADIVDALTAALQFEQRTATGSSIGTNVRDAANFGIWSVSRRYTTEELLSVDTTKLEAAKTAQKSLSVIQWLASQLLLSACLDPAGNIRRGSSAALQELIGRHPDKVYAGIALVQTVDYQAVGLRGRAMEDVANQAAKLHDSYWIALVPALFEWRGLVSPDVHSRKAAAGSLANLSRMKPDRDDVVLSKAMRQILACSRNNVENMHGLVSLLALLIQDTAKNVSITQPMNGHQKSLPLANFGGVLEMLLQSTSEFSLRILRSEFPSAITHLLAALCQALSTYAQFEITANGASLNAIDTLTERILVRHEDTIQQAVPSLVKSLLLLKRRVKVPLVMLGAQQMCKRVALDGSKSTLHSACRAIALGALAPIYDDGLIGEKALMAIITLSDLTSAMNVDWRVVGIKSIQLAIDSCTGDKLCDSQHANKIIEAIHRGANDYTIDERGDVGSLVRLQAIACAGSFFTHPALRPYAARTTILQGDILRLSLEKLDRVRLAAARCQCEHLRFSLDVVDVAAVSSQEYFSENLKQLVLQEVEDENRAHYKQLALLEGCISCAGISAEPLLQASRTALVLQLHATDAKQLQHLLTLFSDVLKSLLLNSKNMHPALELLAFLLDMQIPQRIAETKFKWRALLSTVQKAHYKSNDIPRILAAVHVYSGLADVISIRDEVMKKLISMLKSNPYPKVRSGVAERLYIVIREPELRNRDWTRPASQQGGIIRQLEERYLKS